MATTLKMSGRLINLSILTTLVVAFITGVLTFALGSATSSFVAVAHGVGGLAVAVLVGWKLYRLARRGGLGRLGPLALAALVTLVVASGVLFSTGLGISYGPLSTMQVHVGAALVMLPFAIGHVFSYPVGPRRTDFDRRRMLAVGGVFGIAAATWLAIEGVMRVARLPGADRRFTGSHEQGSFHPQAMPTTQWLNDTVPNIDAEAWRLSLVVGTMQQLRLVELKGYNDEIEATLDCTGGWYSRQRWGGVRLDRLLGEAEGASILVTSATGFRRRFPREDADRLLLATHLGGEPLSAGHGYPARLVAPGRRGFWWVKWVTEIAVDDRSWWLQSPFALT